MSNSRARSIVTATFLLGAALLLGISWWLLQSSYCAGDLKQGVGNVEAAAILEGRAFLVHLIGMVALVTAVVRFLDAIPLWGRGLAVLASVPLAYASFLALALFGGHAPWLCVQ